jgi:hypothetical protein
VIALLVGLYVASVAIYVILGRRQAVPLTNPDEFLYGRLAQSLADGDGLTWRGATVPLRDVLYVYAIAPAWFSASLTDAYAVAKAIGAGLACLAIFPTYLLARRYMGAFLAFIPAVLTVAGTWMISSAGIVTENLAFPLSTAVLAAAVVAIETPGSKWAWVSVGLALVAAGARQQLAVLIPIILCAVVLDAARQRAGWRSRLRLHRALAITTAALTVGGVLFVLASRSAALGIYSSVKTVPPLDHIADALWRESTAVLVLAGIVPLLVVVAATFRRATWADSRLGPLLAVLWATITLTVAESAWIMQSTATRADYQIERYVQYALPLIFVFMVTALDRQIVRARTLALAVAVGVVVVVPVGAVTNRGEERALLGLQRRVNDAFGTSPGVSVALAVLVAGGVVLIVLAAAGDGRRRSAAALIAVVAAVTLGVLAVQQQLAWRFQIDVAKASRSGLPTDIQWVDHAATTPLARFVVTSNSGRSAATEFFNARIKQVYLPDRPIVGTLENGKTCVWRPSAVGVVDFEPGCGPSPTRLLLDDDWGKATFYAQRVLRDAPGTGRIVDIPPPGRPRLMAIVYIPCGPPIRDVDLANARTTAPVPHCISPYVAGQFWLDEPATLVVRFRGGATPQQLVAPDRTIRSIPPRTITTMRFPVTAGQSEIVLSLGWGGAPPQAPSLVGARLASPTAAVDLLY